MKNKGFTLVETLVALVIMGLTSGLVIGIITIYRKSVAKTKYYLEIMTTKLNVLTFTRNIDLSASYDENLSLVRNNDDWIIYADDQVVLEYKDRVLYNSMLKDYCEFKDYKLQLEMEDHYLVFVLADGILNEKVYVRWVT